MKTILLIISLFVANQAFADAVGLRISGGMWSYDVTGDIRDSANASDNFSLKNDLGMQEDEVFNGFVYIEHPVPILPNVRLGVTDLKLTGAGNLSAGKTWNSVPITAGPVNSSVDLSHTEIGLYYEIWDTGFDFDLGVNAKFFDGTVNISDDNSNSASSSFDETIPMLYGHIGIPLVAGFSIAGDISYISYDGDEFQDTLIRVRWDSDFLLGVELGYRSLTIDYTDGNEFVDVKVDGPYLNATFTF